MQNQSSKLLQKILRYELVKLSHFGKAAHLGSSLSCIDILIALYWKFLKINPQNPFDSNRDRFILSKGHAISSLYVTLAYRDFFNKKLLETFNKNASRLPEHPSPKSIPGLEAATGSLGHGLSIGLGHALAGKILQKNYKVVILLGDGECNEGTIWEAALLAPAKNLNNVIVIIDFNKWQATDRSTKAMSLAPLDKKWSAFGWDTYTVDGHNIQQISILLNKVTQNQKKPIAIIANTIKGKGISFMEDDNNWHYRIPTIEEVKQAKEELNEKCIC